jgi:hypothetical protein
MQNLLCSLQPVAQVYFAKQVASSRLLMTTISQGRLEHSHGGAIPRGAEPVLGDRFPAWKVQAATARAGDEDARLPSAASNGSSSSSSSRTESLGHYRGGNRNADPGPKSGREFSDIVGGPAAGNGLGGGKWSGERGGGVGGGSAVPKLRLTAANLKTLGGRGEEAFAESSDEEIDQREGFFARTTQKVTCPKFALDTTQTV